MQLESPPGPRRADPESLAVPGLDGAQSRHARQIDHAGRLEQAVLQLREQIGAAGEQLRFGTTLGGGFDALVNASRKDQLESSHARSPLRKFAHTAARHQTGPTLVY